MNLSVFKSALTAAALTIGSVAPAAAAWVGADNVLGSGETITNTNANAQKMGWTGNSTLNFDAWGMEGSWLSFQLTGGAADTTISATAGGTTMAPAFTLYRTNSSYTGQSVALSGGVNGAIHKFSQVAQAGQNGLIWASAKTAGGAGIVETLGYANSGNSYAANSFGQAVNYGVNDVSIDNLYESGISGSVGAGLASMTLHNLASGWYTIFISGANGALTGSPINVSVSAVPVPGAVWLFGSALAGLIGASRRKLNA